MRRVFLLALVAVLAFPSGPARAQTASSYVEPQNLHDLVAAAAKEGRLTLAIGAVFGGAEGARAIQTALDRRYRVNLAIDYTPVNGGVQFAQQLIQEVRAGQTASSDLMLAKFGSSDAARAVQVVDYRKYVPGLPEDVMYFGKRAVALYDSLQAFDYNTKLVPANDVPKSFADLLKPEWKGKVATSPYQGSFLNYIGLPSVMGHQGMVDYLAKFAPQIGGLMQCGEIDRVASGEFAIFGIDCGDYEVRKRQRKGEPLATFYPREGTERTYMDPSIPLTAPHPSAARLFLTFLLTREGQDVLWSIAASDNDRLPGSHMAPLVAQLQREGVKIVDGMEAANDPLMATYAREITGIIQQGR